MRPVRARFVLIASGLLAVLTLLGGVFVYDATRADRIAPGVTVNGIDVGELRAGEARVKLREELLEPLQRPILVRHADRRFKLTARQARLRVDVESSVQQALAASRSGDLFARTWRELTGVRVEHDVEASVRYSRESVQHLVARVGETLNRDAVDADIDIDASGVDVRHAKEGRRLNAGRLERQLHRRLIDFDAKRRTVRAQTVTISPSVTDDDLESRYPAVLIVDREAFTLTLYKGLKEAKRYEVAVGKVGMETPRGLYQIQNKAINPAWHVPDSEWAGDLAGKVIAPDDPKNPIKARWMGIYDGAGIHGTDADESIGSAASHGCIRMRIPEVIELYDDVPVNAPVYIA
jgi:lipoprotein-anchoring transpeptidase ErfK/SrfK